MRPRRPGHVGSCPGGETVPPRRSVAQNCRNPILTDLRQFQSDGFASRGGLRAIVARQRVRDAVGAARNASAHSSARQAAALLAQHRRGRHRLGAHRARHARLGAIGEPALDLGDARRRTTPGRSRGRRLRSISLASSAAAGQHGRVGRAPPGSRCAWGGGRTVQSSRLALCLSFSVKKRADAQAGAGLAPTVTHHARRVATARRKHDEPSFDRHVPCQGPEVHERHHPSVGLSSRRSSCTSSAALREDIRLSSPHHGASVVANDCRRTYVDWPDHRRTLAPCHHGRADDLRRPLGSPSPRLSPMPAPAKALAC